MKSITVTKKTIIISVISIVILAGGIVGSLIFVKGLPGQKVETKVSLEQPKNDAVTTDPCALLSTNDVKTIFGANAAEVTLEKQADATAPNGEPAQQCLFTIKNSSGATMTLLTQTYSYKPAADGQKGEDPIPASWYNLSKTPYPTYLTDQKPSATSKFYTTTVRIINGPINYLLTLQQPESTIVYDLPASIELAKTIAPKLSY
jgi:hypothetical protein